MSDSDRWREGPPVHEYQTRAIRERDRVKRLLKEGKLTGGIQNFDKRFGQRTFNPAQTYRRRRIWEKYPRTVALVASALAMTCVCSRMIYGWMFEMNRAPTAKEIQMQIRIDEAWMDKTFLGFKLHTPPPWSPVNDPEWREQRAKEKLAEQQRMNNTQDK